MNHQVDGQVCVRACMSFTWDEMAPVCTTEKGQAGGGSVMLWTLVYWETVGPDIHVDFTLTRTTSLNTVADQRLELIQSKYRRKNNVILFCKPLYPLKEKGKVWLANRTLYLLTAYSMNN